MRESLRVARTIHHRNDRVASLNRKRLAITSWWLAGFKTVVDWVGSRQEWFEYTVPLENDDHLSCHWLIARERARAAVTAVGLGAARAAPLQSFAEVTRKASPTPTQAWAQSVNLPDEPLLAIIEDATGSGKTEAAQMLVRVVTWAMPRRCTSTRALGRVSSVPATGSSNLSERSLAALGCRSQVSRSSASGIRPK